MSIVIPVEAYSLTSFLLVVHHGEGILMDFQMGSAVGNLMGDVIEEQLTCY